MANNGAKFMLVNLNRSYGQQNQHSHHNHQPHSNVGGGGSYGQAAAAAGRGRPGSGSGGGRMLVLSRNRGGPPKVIPKLSVPPPLNLPSLRKEHEKFDVSGSGVSGAGVGIGSGSRPNSSGVGWTKNVAAATAAAEKNETGDDTHVVEGINVIAGKSRVVGSYMPPSARSTGSGFVGSASVSRDFSPSVEKTVFLRGDDFPSLQATRPVSSETSQKQKNGLTQKQKQVLCEESIHDKEDNYHLGPLVDMHPLGQFSKNAGGNRSVKNGGEVGVMVSGRMADQIRKQEEYLPDPLPLVHLNPRSDWADDERDTSHGFVGHVRDIDFSNSESYWDIDFDLPRPNILPHKLAPNEYGRWGRRDNETGKNFSSEVPRMDPYNKDVRIPSRQDKEVRKWRTSLLSKDGFSSQETGSYRVDVGSRQFDHNMLKDNKYTPLHYGDSGRDNSAMLNRDSAFGRRDLGHVRQHQQRNSSMESFNHVSEQHNRYRGDNFQNNTLSKSSLGSSGKMLTATDPILTMDRDKRFSNSDRPFSDDAFSRDFDETNLFSEGLVGVIKRKKDAAKLTDFHDPVRESFEAELERVQKMQEMERQRIIEEQQRSLEQAQREKEERHRRIKEEEERQRMLEHEAREAAWRAKQEQREAIQKAEELRMAREEERKRLQLKEEMRKQAAKQKLQELEAMIAKRQGEAARDDGSATKSITDGNLEAEGKETVISRELDLDTWEDGERMMDHVMTSGSLDSSAHKKHVDLSSRSYPPREGPSNFPDRGKYINSWRRDALENGSDFPSQVLDQEAGRYSPRRDAFGGGRVVQRNEFHGGVGHMSSRAYLRAGPQEPYPNELGYQKDHMWNNMNADSYEKVREMDSEFLDSVADKYGDSGWGQGFSEGNIRPPYPGRFYPNSETNELYSSGRSRYAMRQPRVLPPPSFALAQRTNFRGVAECVGPSTSLDSGVHYTHASRTESTRQTSYYGSNQVGLESSDIFGLQQENCTSEEQKLNKASRCDSQCSLSVSSPPTSPPHLSHDELDESGDLLTSALVTGKINLLTKGEYVVHNSNPENGTTVVVSDSVSVVEDEEWTIENNHTLQQQEEYDEDEDAFREEDEVREKNDVNLELQQNFERLEFEERESPDLMENVVLGFDEGVQVVLPNDDFEKKLGTQERSLGIMEERGTVVELPSDENSLLPDGSNEISADSSSGKVQEKSELQVSIGQHGGTPYSLATSDLIDVSDSSGSTKLAAQETISASGDVTAATSRATNNDTQSLSSVGGQGDLPVKLQFGLFSGPSLIPSPMPAIQIGSIQMPLHIHPPIGPSITHMHPSQPSMFQFGQLQYTSHISQGLLPMAPQSMSFVQPDMLGHINLNQKTEDSRTQEYARDNSTQNVTKGEVPSVSINNQSNFVSASLEQSNGSRQQQVNIVLNTNNHADKSVLRSSPSGVFEPYNEKIESESSFQAEDKGHRHAAPRSYLSSSRARGAESQLHLVQPVLHPPASEKNFSGHRGAGPLSGGRARRFTFAVKNGNTRSFGRDHDMPPDSNGFQRRPRRTFQRTEFRIRENNDRRPTSLSVSSNNASFNDKSYYVEKVVGVYAKTGSKRSTVYNKSLKQRIEPESSSSEKIISQEVNSGDRAAKEMAKDLSIKSQNTSHPDETSLRRNASEEDVDAPLQTGVVRVFKQPGIEAASDDDDFIEVRSKRQMLNDRREQREKEIKSKARAIKPSRKPRVSREKDVVSRSQNKLFEPLSSGEASKRQLEFASSDGPPFANSEVATRLASAACHHPIGTPAISSEAHAIKSPHAGSVSLVSSGDTELESGLIFDSKNKVMSLSQTQIDEAMKPARYDSHISAVKSHSTAVSDPISTKDKTFSSGASPINSLLAGEKIQFGAVTFATLLPPTSHAVSHGIGAPGCNRPDVQMSRNFSASEKEKRMSDSRIQDREAEVEATASAVAVATISSDEIIENQLGSVNDTKSFGGADIDGITKGFVENQHLTSQSHGDESLSVSLPADLSVETTPISLWPPLPSPQDSSSQMLSHFPRGPHSHFPFYEMNPLLGGHIFAFNPHDESSVAQSQPPKNAVSSSSRPLGNWQQCRSGVDSFYSPPSGYSGPFIGPSGGIPGVQAPPHMVVYNHFAPVGQYGGQVGLSFMGTTYIPSGKQVDSKNTSTSSAMHIGEGDINDVNMANMQRSAPNMTTPIQHLAPGSPLLLMPPPMPMFDVSPFQSQADLPRWGQIPPSPLHPIPISRPSQQQVEGALPSHVNHGHPIDQSLIANRFTESRNPTAPSDKGPNFTVAPTTEMGLVDPSRSTTTTASSVQSACVQSSYGNANAESGKIDTRENVKHQNASSVRTPFSKKNSTGPHSSNNGYNYQRGGMSQRGNMGNDYSRRRMGFQGRNHSTGVDNKGFTAPKIKQIYVAKQTSSSGGPTA